jgi:amino acid adenylation domain-containing protein
MSNPQRHRVLVDFNNTQRDYPGDATLHALFESQAIQTPDAPAAVFENEQLTYRQLNGCANALANHLRERGVHANMPVGVCLERSLNLPVALLGILKAGGGYVALDPEYPSDRLRVVLAESRVPILITTRALAASLPDHQAQTVCLDAGAIADGPLAAGNPSRPANPGDLAYVIYTSGSTGRPKGVMVSHRAAANRLFGMQEDYRLNPSDVILQKAPYSFDVSIWEFFWTLMAGARMVIAKPHGHQNHDYLIDLIRRHQVTTLHFVPPVLDVFLQHPECTNCASLKRVFCGGESLSSQTQRRFFEHLDAELHHLYGPTEVTIDATSWVCQRSSHLDTVPIGRPVQNVQIYILDPQMDPVPPGTPGELYVGGVQVAIGYLNRPDLTAERFIPDPFSGAPGARLYRTGDLGRWRQDGTIDFLGRLDQQVKIRGVRIELEEIESVLNQHPSIRQCAVAAEGDGLDRQLVAYITADAASPTNSDLRAHLAERLPEAMVPWRFVALETMPFSLNGKIDRAALRLAPRHEKDVQRQLTVPQTDTERQLAEIWQEVLGIPQIGIDENFFEMGGHSLRVTLAIAHMWDRFDAAVTLPDFFDRPTIAQLGAILDRQLAVRVDQPRSRVRVVPPGQLRPVRPVRREGPLPASFAQERLWFIEQFESGTAVYNISWGRGLCGPLNVAALESSLQELVRRHEVLRTTFATVNGQPQPVVLAAPEFRLHQTDLRNLPAGEREAQARRLAQEEASRPFDLSRDLMLRAQLIRLDDQEHRLVLTMHHIASDGWSLGVFERELTALYEAYSAGRPSPLPDLPVQYADYAVWQREWLQREVLEQQLAYWKQQLAGAPAVLELPTDFPRPAVQSYQGATRELVLDANLTVALQELSRRENATLFMTLLAAWQVLLSRYARQEDVSVGAPIAGRNRAELEGLIGFFVNTLVLRTDLSGNPTFRELLRRVREVTLGAYTHQDLPFEKLVEELKPERNLSHSPLFQVMFVLQNAPASPLELAGLTVRPLPLETATAKCDLMLSLEETENGLRGTLAYNTDLFEDATIHRLLGHFQVLLAGILADPEQKIGELPLLTAEERRELLIDWNQTATDYPHEQVVHQLFEEQVERTPEAIAVICEGRQLTYRELNAQANRLAHYLASLMPAPGCRVAVYLDRSVDFIVSVLAILKAGGTYLPLEVTEPEARLRLLLEGASVRLVIAHTRHTPPVDPNRVRMLLIDDASVELDRQPESNLQYRCTADELAYVIYTSGSTGQPKGVMVPHRGVVRLVCGANYADFDNQQRFLLLASPAFDASTFELWGALLHGSTCVVYPRPVPELDHLEAVLRDQRITCLWLTSSLFNMVVDLRPEMLAGLGRLLIGGEALSLDHVRRFRNRWPDVELINGYGPTENTTFTCTFRIPATVPADWTSIPIGRPIANTEAYVLDRLGHLVPRGIPGELCIGGAGMARGYLDAPELTAEKFMPHFFAAVPRARLYRTGDLVRWRSDGNLEYLGRIDHQVKLRGFRIELGEIEAALARHPEVTQAVVLLREDRPGDKRLVAYVALGGQRSVSRYELHKYLEAQLPAYMLPSAVVVLESMPLTSNGKLDRKALPASDASSLAFKVDYAAPRDAIEEQMAAQWAGLLGVEKVGIHNNFFLLGGHSLLAAKFIAEARSQYNVALSLRDLFETPTVAALVSLVKQKRKDTERSGPLAEGEQSPHVAAAAGSKAALEVASGQLFLRASEEDATYLRVFRQGKGQPPVLCVGDARFVPLILERLPASVPVLLLGLDGCHVWPPQYLTVEQQVATYVAALKTQTAARKAAMVGYSYGGLLAYRLASALLEQGWEQVKVNLVEPSLPYRYLPVGLQLQEYLEQARSWVRRVARLVPGRRPAQMPLVAIGAHEIPDVEARWNRMASHYHRNVRNARLVPLGRRIGIVGTKAYHAQISSCWKLLEPGGVDECILPLEVGHSEVFREDCGIQWIQFLERSYNRLCAPDGSSISDLEAENESATRIPTGASR